jgi:hypothetical protein
MADIDGNVGPVEEYVEWHAEDMIEVTFAYQDDFLKIKETLTRIGIASKVNNTLYQSCHILHRKDKYYICHFKELFALDGKTHSITKKDIRRRNTIIHLLQEWELLTVVNMDQIEDRAPLYQIKILRYDEVKNGDWKLEQKYNLGKFKAKKD